MLVAVPDSDSGTDPVLAAAQAADARRPIATAGADSAVPNTAVRDTAVRDTAVGDTAVGAGPGADPALAGVVTAEARSGTAEARSGTADADPAGTGTGNSESGELGAAGAVVADVDPEHAAAPTPSLWRSLAVYTVLRFGLLAVLAVLLQFLVPLVVALAMAVVLQLPLSVALFGKQRAELSAAMAPRLSRRHAERARLRAELHGD